MKSQRHLSFFMVVALLVTVIAVTLPPALSAVAAPPAQEFSATLTPVAGLVQYLARGSTDWVTLRDTQLFGKGDQLRTGSDGYARLNVVSGIQVDIYQTAIIEMNSLAMGDDKGETFSLFQLRGLTFSNVSQAVKQQDRIEIIMPSAGITVRGANGAQFYTFISPAINAGVVSQQDKVDVETIDAHVFNVTVDDFLYIKLKPVQPPPLTCTDQFLKDNAKATFVNEPVVQDKLQAMREFMHDSVISNVDPQVRLFFRQLMGMQPVDLTKLTADEDQQDMAALLKAIDAADGKTPALADFLKQYRDFWGKYKTTLTKPLSPATCGNGKQDDGETADNCPNDFNDQSACGNGLCEIDRRGLGESVINCPADCLSYGDFGALCAKDLDDHFHPQPKPTGIPGPKPKPHTATPTFTPVPAGTATPHPSGVG